MLHSDLLYCVVLPPLQPLLPQLFGTLPWLLVLITLGLIELRLISPLLTALLQAQPYLLAMKLDLSPLDFFLVVIAGPELFPLNPFYCGFRATRYYSDKSPVDVA